MNPPSFPADLGVVQARFGHFGLDKSKIGGDGGIGERRYDRWG